MNGKTRSAWATKQSPSQKLKYKTLNISSVSFHNIHAKLEKNYGKSILWECKI